MMCNLGPFPTQRLIIAYYLLLCYEVEKRGLKVVKQILLDLMVQHSDWGCLWTQHLPSEVVEPQRDCHLKLEIKEKHVTAMTAIKKQVFFPLKK